MSDPVRLPPLPYQQWTDDAKAVLPTFLRRPELYAGPGARPMPNALGLLANNVGLGQGWLAFNGVLATEATVDLRLREIVILRVAWRTRSAYEWAQHTRIGSQAGLTTEQLHAIADGPVATLWTPVERTLLAAVDEMVDNHGVTDETWAELAAHFSREQLLEVIFVAGTYLCFAVVCNSAGLAPDLPAEQIGAPQLPGLACPER